MQNIYRTVGVAATGQRVGQDHPKAILLDDEVELVRQLFASTEHMIAWTHQKLAEKFLVHTSTICRILSKTGDYKSLILNAEQIEEIRSLYAYYKSNCWTYTRLAEKFEVSVNCIKDIVSNARRISCPARYKRERIKD